MVLKKDRKFKIMKSDQMCADPGWTFSTRPTTDSFIYQ